MEEKYKASKDTLEKKIILGDNQEKNKFNLNESEPKDMDAKDKEIYELNGKLRKYQNEAKILKEKAHKASAELNKTYLERNKLENIFNDCINATKKIIYNRKLKDNKSYKIKNKTGLGKYDIKIDFTTRYEDFLPGDKKERKETKENDYF